MFRILKPGNGGAQHLGVIPAFVHALFIGDRSAIQARGPRVLRHFAGQLHPIFHDTQGNADGFIRHTLLFCRQHLGRVGVADLTAEPQRRFVSHYGQHLTASLPAARHRRSASRAARSRRTG